MEAKVAIIQATLAEVAISNDIQALTTERIKEAGDRDPVYTILRRHLTHGEPWPQALTTFNRHRLDMHSSDGLVFFKDRLLIPAALRREAINHLHCGHQGSTSRVLRAQDCIWWPRINEELDNTSASCVKCQTIKPSQRKEPPIRPPEL